MSRYDWITVGSGRLSVLYAMGALDALPPYPTMYFFSGSPQKRSPKYHASPSRTSGWMSSGRMSVRAPSGTRRVFVVLSPPVHTSSE